MFVFAEVDEEMTAAAEPISSTPLAI